MKKSTFKKLAVSSILSTSFLFSHVIHASEQVITMFGGADTWQNTLLETALKHSGKDYELHKAEHIGIGERAIGDVANGTGDVLWSMTSTNLEERLIPIRIPLFKGLLGNRLLIINKNDEDKFSGMSEEMFQALKVGQVESWPDAKILSNAGLNVVTSVEYPTLYNMLNAQRFDYFTLGAAEIEGEFANLGPATQEIEKTILLQYHSPAYFFVNPAKVQLAQDIERGLKAMIENGSFNKMFYSLPTFKDLHEKLNLSGRKIIYINNPNLPVNTPCDQPELWDSIFVSSCRVEQ